MADGRAEHEFSWYLTEQECEWERVSTVVAMIHNTTREKAEQCKQPDDFNAWLDVPGVELPDAETQRKEDEIIAARKAAKHGGE